MRVFVWAEGRGGKLHNRYVLTEVGGIAVQTGLDRSPPRSSHTDDLTVLSKEQHKARWAEYSASSSVFRLLADSSFTGK